MIVGLFIKMIDIKEIATNLELNEYGIWYSGVKKHISYPKDGNVQCLLIEENSFWFKHRNNCITQVLQLFPPGGPVLDVGGGNGFVSLAIKNAGMEVIVLEPGPEGAINSKMRGLNPVICSTLEGAGFKSHSISAIGAFDVIEHIEDDDNFLETVKTLMIQGGRLYITVPAYNFLFSDDDVHAGHYRRYTLGSLTAKLKMHDFQIDFQSYIFEFLPIPVFLFRTIPSKLGLRKGNNPEQKKKEHQQRTGVFNEILQRLLAREIKTLRQKKSLLFGGSCLVSARLK